MNDEGFCKIKYMYLLMKEKGCWDYIGCRNKYVRISLRFEFY